MTKPPHHQHATDEESARKRTAPIKGDVKSAPTETDLPDHALKLARAAAQRRDGKKGEPMTAEQIKKVFGNN